MPIRQRCVALFRSTVVRKGDVTDTAMIHTLMLTFVGLVGSVLWLSLLVATGFSRAILSVGLLAMLFLINDPRRTRA